MIRWILSFLFIALLIRLSAYTAVATNAFDLIKVMAVVFVVTAPLMYIHYKRFSKKQISKTPNHR